MTLTFRDRLRLALKSTEFILPTTAHQVAWKLGCFANPYAGPDHEFKTIFIHVPKSAGTSFRKALYGTKSFHIPAARYKAADPVGFQQYFKFSFVRNPWDRMHSAFAYLNGKKNADPAFPDHRWAAKVFSDVDSFQEFLNKLEHESIFRRRVLRYIHFRDQLSWISQRAGRGRRIIVDYVGRFESLGSDFQFISAKLGVRCQLPHERRRSGGTDFRLRYSESWMVDAVSVIYRDDIDAFGYTFE